MFIHADARALPLADKSVQCCVTSPPYWGLRDYKIAGQIGLESTPELYVQTLVEVFREVKRVLKDDGTLWLNLGDTFCNSDKWGGGGVNTGKHTRAADGEVPSWSTVRRKWSKLQGIKPKDLVGIPWMVAFALRADGWYLRSDIVWAKGYSFHPTTAGSCMPESIKDRPTRGHEYLFLLTKSPKYYYDHAGVQEDGIFPAGTRAARGSGTREGNRRGSKKAHDAAGAALHVVSRVDEARDAGAPHGAGLGAVVEGPDGYAIYSGKRNLRSVWLINPKPFKGAHFATFPPALVTPCIKAGSRPGDLVLDPFSGAGTTVIVAESLGRQGVGIELSPAYLALAEQRRAGVATHTPDKQAATSRRHAGFNARWKAGAA